MNVKKLAGAFGVFLGASVAMAEDAPTTTPTTSPTQIQIRTMNRIGKPLEMTATASASSSDGSPATIFVTTSTKMEKGTFLGIATSAAPAALREQLNLPKGIGLVVETIEDNSPAAAAGLLQYDLVQKLNDQLLINAQQLQVLIRTQKAGDAVKLEIIRHGQPMSLTATLVEKDVPALTDANLTGNSSFMTWQGQGAPAALLNATTARHSQGNWMWKNDDQTLQINDVDQKRKLIIMDKDGKTVFDGPIDDEAQREALPEKVKEALKQMEGKFGSLQVEDRKPEAPTPTPANK